MRKRIYLPKSMAELKSTGIERIRELWVRYFKDSIQPPALVGDSRDGESQSIPAPGLPEGCRDSAATNPLPLAQMLRPLWYKIQCENHNLHVDQKNITRLNKYAADPEGCIEKAHTAKYYVRSGTEIVKTFKGKHFKVLVRSPSEFIYDGQCYRTLSAAAKAMCGKKVSGYDFFGINNKRLNANEIQDTDGENLRQGESMSESCFAISKMALEPAKRMLAMKNVIERALGCPLPDFSLAKLFDYFNN